MSSKPTNRKVSREARLRWVPLAEMRVNPHAQRELKISWVDKIVAEMDLEQLGNPTVSLRDGWYYIIDGQHRMEALKKWLGEDEWKDQSLQCWTYEDLSEETEAEKFLKLNSTLTVSTFEKFVKAVNAGRIEETDIDRIVRAQDLRVSRERVNGAVGSVGALRKVYKRGPATLSRTLRVIRDAYGDAGLEGPIIEGIGLMCHRYNGDVEDDRMIKRLSGTHGGKSGLTNSAERLRQQTGHPRSQCIAAAAVDIYNRGRGGKKIKPWWRDE